MALLNRPGRLALVVGVFTLSIMLGAGVGLVAGYLRSAPTLDQVYFNPELTTYIYDRNGETIARLYKENRVRVSIKDIPLTLQHAVVAIEDSRFYSHYGIDLRAIARAIVADLRSRGKAQGASTITQQLARNAFLTLEKTFSRKLKEILWAVQIERKYSKEEILEAYLNEIYVGHGAYGVEAAAQLYFGKSVRDLNLAESAFIAGLLQVPEVYSPFNNLEAGLNRRNVVLTRMAELGYITKEQAEIAKKQPLKTVQRKGGGIKAPYFTDYVVQLLLQEFGESLVYTGGLKVYTTLDMRMQEAAEESLARILASAPHKQDANGLKQPQAALISLDPANGHILAMVGGRGDDKYNRALMAVRQPGSAMKPFVYLAAMERGFTPATVVVDEPVRFPLSEGQMWEPANDDRKYRGPITVREALEGSINTVAVKLANRTGIDSVLDYARRLGLSTLVLKGEPNDRNLSTALGGLTRGVTPLELAVAYGAIANQGVLVQPIALTKVLANDGTVLAEYTGKRDTVLRPQTAYLVTDMMRGVVERGTGVRAKIGRPVAGKTGTTEDYTNAWFVGYTPDVVTAVWLGNDNQKDPMTYTGYGNIGSGLAAEIFGTYMRRALADRPAQDFARPSGIEGPVLIDIKTGHLVPPGCQLPVGETRMEIFMEGTTPTTVSQRCGAASSSP